MLSPYIVWGVSIPIVLIVWKIAYHMGCLNDNNGKLDWDDSLYFGLITSIILSPFIWLSIPIIIIIYLMKLLKTFIVCPIPSLYTPKFKQRKDESTDDFIARIRKELELEDYDGEF